MMKTTTLLALLLILSGCCGLSDKGCPISPPCSTGVCHSVP